MPFTLSHPAIILPLNYAGKKYISITALIIGSLVPDFEYFIRMRNYSIYSHTWPGLLWLDLPMGIMLCFLFHNIVRNPLIDHLPDALRERFIPYRNFNWNERISGSWRVVCLSVLIGALSHLLWDRLTHRSSSLLAFLPYLEENAFIIRHPKLVYRLFQTLYSFTGLAIISYAIWQLPRHTIAGRNSNTLWYWFATACLAAGVYVVNLFNQSALSLQDYIGSAISALLFSIIVSSVVLIVVKNVYTAGKG